MEKRYDRVYHKKRVFLSKLIRYLLFNLELEEDIWQLSSKGSTSTGKCLKTIHTFNPIKKTIALKGGQNLLLKPLVQMRYLKQERALAKLSLNFRNSSRPPIFV